MRPLMERRTLWAMVVAVAAMVVVPLEVGAAPMEPPGGEPIRWHSTGDSYSSGEGVFGNSGECAQSDRAYGPLIVTAFRNQGWTIEPAAFTACTGHLAEDFRNSRRGGDGASRGLAGWAAEQGLDGPADVVTMSFGGNDIGFDETIKGCLGFNTSGWEVDWSGAGACSGYEADLEARIDALVAPTREDCSGGRHEDNRDSSFGFDCTLLLDDGGTAEQEDDRRGSLTEFYRMVRDDHVSDRGHLVVVGYPAIFAPTDEWSNWSALGCGGVFRSDAQMLERLAQRLDDRLREAVLAADGGAGRIHYVSTKELYRAGGHELCGTGPDWLNGISNNRSGGFSHRTEGSFHPNARGHWGTAQAVGDKIWDLSFDAPAGALQLSGDGVDGVGFGSPAAEGLETLRARLGDADADTGWQRFFSVDELDDDYGSEELLGEFYAAPDDILGDSWQHRYHRRACWQSLCVHFGGPEESSASVTGWELAEWVPAAGYTPDSGLPDAELEGTGIRLGSTWAELQAAYPGVVAGGAEGNSLAVDNRPWDGIFDGVATWRLSGLWDFERPTFAPADAQITRLSAGDGPEPGCC